MSSVNKVILVGNLGRDPEVRHTPSGSAVCNLAVATSRSWKDKTSGDRQEETEWHRIVCYDKLAEIAGEYLRKGKSVYIEGRLKTRKWTDKDGVEKYTTEIICEQMQMLGSRDAGDSDRDDSGSRRASSAPQRQQAAARQQGAPARRPATTAGDEDEFSDSIPF